MNKQQLFSWDIFPHFVCTLKQYTKIQADFFGAHSRVIVALFQPLHLIVFMIFLVCLFGSPIFVVFMMSHIAWANEAKRIILCDIIYAPLSLCVCFYANSVRYSSILTYDLAVFNVIKNTFCPHKRLNKTITESGNRSHQFSTRKNVNHDFNRKNAWNFKQLKCDC